MGRWFTLDAWLDELSSEFVRTDASFAALDAEARRAATGWLPIAPLGIEALRVTAGLVREDQTAWGRLRLAVRRWQDLDATPRFRLRTPGDRTAVTFECVVERRPGAAPERSCKAVAGG